MLIIGRAVAGLGASGLTNGALTILAAAVPMHKRPGKFFSYYRKENANVEPSNDGHYDGK
jgi:MFS family permease